MKIVKLFELLDKKVFPSSDDLEKREAKEQKVKILLAEFSWLQGKK